MTYQTAKANHSLLKLKIMQNLSNNYQSILNLVQELPNDKKNHHGFFCTEINEKGITFTGSKSLVWFQETVLPIIENARDNALDVQTCYDVTRISPA